MNEMERREVLLGGSAIVAAIALPGSAQTKSGSSQVDHAALLGCDLLGTADPFWTEAAASLLGVRLSAVT